ncbi:DUF5683 domain-containing protein [Robertkochia flava]|uniref:DUF5683 domain-containing protein n=1 Tax=Robertkochia flava TaxID=3447986 RepID=UPI001CC9F5C0|nr:DUF5683 domain-containing protein [Robertkochia marina]
MQIKYLAIFLLCLSHLAISAQETQSPASENTKTALTTPGIQGDSLSKKEIRRLQRQQRKDSLRSNQQINPLSPARAAFYSAILPGLGQIYNKSYWKVPLVYGAIGTGLYFYINNTNEYNRYRDAYKSRLAGFQNDEFYDINNSGIIPGSPDVSDEALRNAQEFYQRNRDLSLLITVGLYALNIIDANVDAHLKQYNVNDNLSFKPFIEQDQTSFNTNFGLTLNLKF